LHFTIDSWRGNRDEDGWRQSRPGHDFYPEGHWNGTLCTWEKATQPTNRPQFVRPVTRYSDDLQALTKLIEAEDPPLRFIRQNKIHTALYGFVDASSSGFGSSFTTPSGTYYSYGIWGKDHEGDSSNYRELNNLVTTIEALLADGTLVGAETFVFTDNFTAESAFYKGNTSSKTLFDLVLRRARQK